MREFDGRCKMNCRCPYCTAPFDHDVWGPDDEIEKLQKENQYLRAALERIGNCDFVITLPDRMDAVRAIAREALE